jgi:hypothetical protein
MKPLSILTCLAIATPRGRRHWPIQSALRYAALLGLREDIRAPTLKQLPAPMYITDLTHFLDESGAIAPVKGPARAMAQFLVDVVAHASDATSKALPAPKCFKCDGCGRG